MMCSRKSPPYGGEIVCRCGGLVEETGLIETPRPKAGNISSTRISGTYAAASKVPAPYGEIAT